ncbi:MAG: hypothetical protein QOH97_4981 [Actinoplanes sp.]|jgi:hypothetical protein|nr:hypothetical protein [Actinoplanes sp.]
MRVRIAGLVAGLATALIAPFTGSAPAIAAPADAPVARAMASTQPVQIHFYNDGWYWAYADLWGRDANGVQVYHDWSGTVGHTGNRWFTVPANVATLDWEVRMDPVGTTIHHEIINPWYDFSCSDGKHATIYVGGTVGSTNDYDLHCSKW